MEGLKWLVTTLSNALVHIVHVRVMANVANALHIIAKVEKFQDAFFPKLVKRLMTGQLRISTKIIRRIVKICCLPSIQRIQYIPG